MQCIERWKSHVPVRHPTLFDIISNPEVAGQDRRKLTPEYSSSINYKQYKRNTYIGTLGGDLEVTLVRILRITFLVETPQP